tara:strand:+ start:521 stop:691 length:171 start_codon:yes stop_codon:yes gene_type:complete
MNFVFRLRKRDRYFGTRKTKDGRRYDFGKLYLHLSPATHFWNINGIVDIRGRTFMV